VAFTGAFVANGLGFSPGRRNAFSTVPLSTPPFSVIRTIALGLPVTSSTFCHLPTGDVEFAPSAAPRRMASVKSRPIASSGRHDERVSRMRRVSPSQPLFYANSAKN
jgi:hypothetical protein